MILFGKIYNKFFKFNGIAKISKKNSKIPESNYPKLLEKWYFSRTGNYLNLKNPQTFNEKLQWLKLYDRNPLKTKLSDKYLVREWVSEKIGEKYLVPLLGVWNKFNKIDFNKLPKEFVLKANHGCGWNIIVDDKDRLDKRKAKNLFDNWAKINYAFVSHGFELNYKDIPPKIIAEKLLKTPDGNLLDYKFMCFNGIPEFVWVDSARFTAHKRNIFNMEWNPLPFEILYPASPSIPVKPKNFELMKNLVKILCKGFPSVRVDLYEHEDKVYFGEMTFYSGNGKEKFNPEEYNIIYGEKIILPQ